MGGIRAESFILFNRQLASLLELELPLSESLRRSAADLGDPRLACTVAELAAEVERGASYTQAVAARAGRLPRAYAAIVRAGEASGRLAEALHHAASYSRDMLALREKARANMIYPAMLLAALLGLFLLVAFFIGPNMALIYEGSGARLPFSTRLLMGLVAARWALLALALPAAGAVWAGRGAIARWWEEYELRAALWGEFARAAYLSRFSGLLGALLESGVGLPEALDLAAETAGSRPFARAVAGVRDAVARGERLGAALGSSPLFPSAFSWMVAAAEEREELERALRNLAAHYGERARLRGERMARLIEPALIALLACVVGAVVIELFAPVYDLAKVFD